MSLVPLGLSGMSTIRSWPIPDEINSSKTISGGIKCWFCPCKYDRSQALLCKIAVIRSHITSEMTHHLYGHSFPPKVSQRLMKASSKLGIWVTGFIAVSQFKWHQWYADLKSSIFENILQPGYFNLAATVQLINLVCMVVVECRWLKSLRSFLNYPTSSSDRVSINLLQWSCQVCWLSTVLGYLTGPCICLELSQLMQLQQDPISVIDVTWDNFRSNSGCISAPLWFPNFIASWSLLLVLIQWWVWVAIVIHGEENFSYKAKGNDCRAMVQGFLAFWIHNRIRLGILLVLLLLFQDLFCCLCRHLHTE